MSTRNDPDNPMANMIRAAFRESGMSIKTLSVKAQVPYATVHGFVSGVRDVALSSASKMAETLGLELRPVRRGKRKA